MFLCLSASGRSLLAGGLIYVRPVRRCFVMTIVCKFI